MSIINKSASPPTIPSSAIFNTIYSTIQTKTQTPIADEDATTKLYVDERVTGGTTSDFYQDNPPSGNTSRAFYIKLPEESIGKLVNLKCRWEFPYSTSESSSVRLYRYRKVNGIFTYTQITDIITLNSSLDWSTWHDFTSYIRNYDLNPSTDTVTVTNIHTSGSSPSVRALNIVFTVGVGVDNNESSSFLSNTPNTQTWPPI